MRRPRHRYAITATIYGENGGEIYKINRTYITNYKISNQRVFGDKIKEDFSSNIKILITNIHKLS